MPDGQLADWDILEGGRVVGVLALTADEQVIMVRQFRPGPGRVLLELPGGGVEDGEDVVAAAGRELLEETGYTAAKLEVIGHTWLAGNATTQRFAAIATGCQLAAGPAVAGARADPLEFLEPVVVTMDDFRKHVAGGQLTNTDVAFMCLNAMRPG
jgi:ADP-ribose pyrophosphatase